MTQRTTAKLDSVSLKPISEVLLDEQAISRFRSRYRDQFGGAGMDDPLYVAVSDGRRHVGMEHWLPLYYESLETLFDYLPGAALSYDYQVDDVRRTRLETVAEFYAARQSFTGAKRAEAATVYKPVKPDQLFIGEDEWAKILAARAVAQVTPFAPPPEAATGSY